MKKTISLIAAILYILTVNQCFSQTAGTPNSIVTPQTPNILKCSLSSSSAINAFVTCYTGATKGSDCSGISVTSTDTVSHNITMQIQDSFGNVYYQITQTVGIAAGGPPISGGGPAVPFITPSVLVGLPIDRNGNQFIRLISGYVIKFAVSYTSISSGQYIDIYGVCSDY